MELNFTPRTIKEIEDIAKQPIVELIGNYSMGTIALLVQKGSGVDEKGAYDALDTYFKDGGEMHELYLTVLEQLQKRGFLPRSLNLAEIRAEMLKL